MLAREVPSLRPRGLERIGNHTWAADTVQASFLVIHQGLLLWLGTHHWPENREAS